MSNPVDLRRLPDNLPRPTDDGGCDHLKGMAMPNISLKTTTGELVDVASISGRAVIYIYPMTKKPEIPLPDGWSDIPGALGCTPQTLVFNDAHEELKSLGVTVFGLSSQDTEYQLEMSQRLNLTFPVLSDEHFELTKALNLPTMEIAGMTLLKRVTLIILDGVIEHVFYPVFPSNQAAAAVLGWLRSQAFLQSPAKPLAQGVVIYSTGTCPYCAAAKKLLVSKSIPFVEIDLEKVQGAANEMLHRSGGARTVPQIFIHNTHIGGFDKLQALAKDGKLNELLSHK